MSRWVRFRWWLSAKITPKWEVVVKVETHNKRTGSHCYVETRFDKLQPLIEGSGNLYFTSDKLPYLTIMQQGDPIFREAMMVSDLRKRRGGR